jgi:hypothetical protein
LPCAMQAWPLVAANRLGLATGSEYGNSPWQMPTGRYRKMQGVPCCVFGVLTTVGNIWCIVRYWGAWRAIKRAAVRVVPLLSKGWAHRCCKAGERGWPPRTAWADAEGFGAGHPAFESVARVQQTLKTAERPAVHLQQWWPIALGDFQL